MLIIQFPRHAFRLVRAFKGFEKETAILKRSYLGLDFIQKGTNPFIKLSVTELKIETFPGNASTTLKPFKGCPKAL